MYIKTIDQMKLLVIGAGNMGLTYAESMSKSTLLGSKRLQIYDTDPNKIATLKKEKHFEVFTELKDCLPKADIVFIAVKPYHSDALFENMKPLIPGSFFYARYFTNQPTKMVIFVIHFYTNTTHATVTRRCSKKR